MRGQKHFGLLVKIDARVAGNRLRSNWFLLLPDNQHTASTRAFKGMLVKTLRFGSSEHGRGLIRQVKLGCSKKLSHIMERPCDCKQQNIATVTDEFAFPLSGKDHPKPKECVYLFGLVADRKGR